MKKFSIITVMVALSTLAYAQIELGGGSSNVVLFTTSDAPFFINPNNSTTLGNRKSVTDLIGKGLYFPRVNLAQVTSFGITLPAMPNPLTTTNSYSTYLDGLVVYNTGTSTTAPYINPAIGKLPNGKTLKPGFYYYDNSNPTGTSNLLKLQSGTWRELGGGSIDVTGDVYGDIIYWDDVANEWKVKNITELVKQLMPKESFWLPAFNLTWEKGQTYTKNLFDVYKYAFLGGTYPNPQNQNSRGTGFDVPGHFSTAIAGNFDYVITGWDADYILNASVSAAGVLTYTCTSNPTLPKNGAYINILMIRK